MRRTRSKENGSKAARAHSQDDEPHSHDDEDGQHGHGHAHAHPQPTAEVHIADPPAGKKKRGSAGAEGKEKVTRRKSDGHEHDAAHPSLAQHFHPPEHHEEHPQHTHAHEIIFDPCSFLPAVPAAGEKPLVLLDGNTLTLETLVRLSTGKFSLDLSFEAWARVAAAREVVDKIVAEKRVVYGINTGFGNFANVVIPPEKVNQLQLNLIRSHAAGVGHYLPLYQTRMLLALRANVLAKGHSGVKPSTLQTLLTAFNKDCLSAVPEKGTVGASGDLAPLSHLALGLLGEGLMWNPLSRHYEPAGNVLKANDIKPIHLEAKEGLALINGTQFIASLGAEAVLRAERLAKTADVVATLTLEALKGTRKAFFEEIHAVRAHPGQVATAARIRALLNYEKYPSAIADSHKNCGTVQDSYTLRCIPQVHGMTHDTIAWVKSVLTTEINSATDNPMIFAEKGLLISGGNFHGEYPAKAMDYLAIGIHEIANMSERRTERLVNHALSGLPAFLVQAGGLNSGFMIAHCTAAALTSENKVLVHPASSDTISTSAAKEDHVSMGGYAARKAIDVVSNVEKVVAIELMAACQGIDLHRPLKTTEPLEKVWQLVRQTVRMWDGDRFIKPDIDACTALVASGAIWEAARPYIESQK